VIVLQLLQLRYVELGLDRRWAGTQFHCHVRNRFRAGRDDLVVAAVRRLANRAHPGRSSLRLAVVAAAGAVSYAVFAEHYLGGSLQFLLAVLCLLFRQVANERLDLRVQLPIKLILREDYLISSVKSSLLLNCLSCASTSRRREIIFS
jgi:hypothetical protein